jgi:hypothetical protein
LEDRRNVGESRCNFGDGRDRRVKSLMFILMMMMMMMMIVPTMFGYSTHNITLKRVSITTVPVESSNNYIF